MRRPVSGPTTAVTEIQAIAAMSPSSSADCTKLSRRKPRSSRLVASGFASVLIAHEPMDNPERKRRAGECGNLG